MQAEAVKATQRRTVWNVLRRNLSLTAGCLILLCVVFTALFPGLIASQSPTDQNLTAMLAAPLEVDAQRLACRVEDPVYGVLRSGWNERLSVNGAAMEYGGSDQYGVLELREKQQPAADAQA